jgi:hypothetical protein
VTLKAIVTSFSSRTITGTLIVTVIDPCLSTTLVAPNPVPLDMTTSVKVQDINGNSLYVMQTINPFTDTVSVAAPSGTIPNVCGDRTYSISSVILANASSSLNTTELAINPVTGLIKVWTYRN